MYRWSSSSSVAMQRSVSPGGTAGRNPLTAPRAVREGQCMIVDLHAHYPMHLLEPKRANTHAAVVAPWKGSPGRGWLLDTLSRLFNYEGPGGAPAVTVDLLREGEVGAVLSVLFEPFDEMDLSEPYAAPPK